ncbi:MAG: glycosyltransferase [Firmicutes bacterium]|nr:glycosyltransferase [Bacillota bacterium]
MMPLTSYITIILGIFATIFLFFKLPRIKKINNLPNSNEKPTVSIIIPARNEENNLPNILNDLINQNYPIKEIICVDDGSTDATPNIIKSFANNGKYEVKKIGVEKLPKGWKGKTWACQNGASVARGNLLLFIDSDVRLTENSIDVLVEHYLKSRNPISVQPFHTMKKKYEFFSLFFNMIQICSTGLSVIGKRRTQGFYGPLLLIKRDLFNKYGGYEKVKNDVVEDYDLGKYLKTQGVEIELYLGGDYISFRMYSESLNQVIEGWSKNFAIASFSMEWWLFLAIISWIAFLTLIPIEIINSLLNAETNILMLLLGIYGISTVLIYRVVKTLGSYPFYTCIIYPIYLLAFHFTYLYSVIGTYFLKSTTWKGRKL